MLRCLTSWGILLSLPWRLTAPLESGITLISLTESSNNIWNQLISFSQTVLSDNMTSTPKYNRGVRTTTLETLTYTVLLSDTETVSNHRVVSGEGKVWVKPTLRGLVSTRAPISGTKQTMTVCLPPAPTLRSQPSVARGNADSGGSELRNCVLMRKKKNNNSHFLWTLKHYFEDKDEENRAENI